ncbi:MAG TPA: DUF488 domain-containing protein [Phycisphaerales bacterium]|nr:DUF488 domain-containing protein [Phycisphaerales bacterium]
MRVLTIGHSSRTAREFLDLVTASGIAHIADIRHFPGSRAHPHFGQGALRAGLASIGVGYTHFPRLGGRRRPDPAAGDRNAGWEHSAFRGFADYARTPEFAAGLEELLGLAAGRTTAMMCSEAVWWRCHRRIVTDYLLVRGVAVEHVLGPGQVRAAILTPFARPGADGIIEYAPAPRGDSLFGGAHEGGEPGAANFPGTG